MRAQHTSRAHRMALPSLNPMSLLIVVRKQALQHPPRDLTLGMAPELLHQPLSPRAALALALL